MEKTNITNNIRRLRFDADEMTQQELADKAGVTRQTISLIESGKYNPTLSLCLNICFALNKTLNELFWEER